MPSQSILSGAVAATLVFLALVLLAVKIYYKQRLAAPAAE